MNYWLEQSIEYANQRTYLDDLYKVYPTIPEGIRQIDQQLWEETEHAFYTGDNLELVISLLKFDLFPIKDSYIAYLRRDPSSLLRNPKTVDRISGRLREMGLDEIFKRCSEPKETNRQIGPLFRRWVRSGVLGFPILSIEEFANTNRDGVLDASDAQMQLLAAERLNYQREKGLDFFARIGGRYMIGEAKFLTDFGGHQNAQFEDALSTMETPNVNATIIGILDGVLYIPSNNKLYRAITTQYQDYDIFSSLMLRSFLYAY